MLENRRWQPIPGCSAGEIFPVLRSPDATCSNTYILQTSLCLAVIDPGADPEQTALILETLNARLRQRPRPVLICLTHCHRDHAWGAAELLARDLSAQVLAHETGVKALQDRDRELTMAYLFNEDPPALSPLIPLLTRADRASASVRELALTDGHSLTLHTHSPLAGAQHGSGDQTLALGDAVMLKIDATPGHSPDSVTYWVGDLCFPGDMLVAANPGVAGIPGWDAEALVQSLAFLRRRMAERGLAWACGGHGPPLAAARFLTALEKIGDPTRLLMPITLLDAARADYLKRYAVAALGEAAEVLTAIGGRLQFIAFQLERLEECAEAQRIIQLLDDEAIEAFLVQFQQYISRPEAARLTMALPLKALQILGKIKSLFNEEALQDLIEPSWLRRAQHLINDYCNTLQGLPAAAMSIPVEVNPLIVTTLSRLKQPRIGNQAMLDRLEEPAALTALATRIADHPLYGHTTIRAEIDLGLPPVMIDPSALEDAVVSLVERLALNHVRTLRIQTGLDAEGHHVLIRIATDVQNLHRILRENRLTYLELSMQRYGGQLQFTADQSGESVALKFPKASDFSGG